MLTPNPGPTLQQLKRDFRCLVALETAEHVPHRQSLVQDLLITIDSPTRLLAQGFESANWQLNEPAVELFSSMLRTVAGSKLIEDVHGRVRMAQKGQSHERLTASNVQSIVNSSGILEGRSLPHPAAIARDAFLEAWHTTRETFKAKQRCNPRAHRLPKRSCQTLKRGNRSWAAITEPSLVRPAAGWAWLRLYNPHRLSQQQVQIQATVLAKQVANDQHMSARTMTHMAYDIHLTCYCCMSHTLGIIEPLGMLTNSYVPAPLIQFLP